jgi:general secretion pathway protein G
VIVKLGPTIIAGLIHPFGCVLYAHDGSQVDTTKLQMTRAAERVEIHSLRHELPTNDGGLRDVFADEVPRDSWGNDFIYVTPGPGDLPFDVISLGADGLPGGEGYDADIKYSEM